MCRYILNVHIDFCKNRQIFDAFFNFQGDLSQQDKRCVFLTVHDLGTNRKYFLLVLIYFYFAFLMPFRYSWSEILI